MPLYDYSCEDCGPFRAWQPMSAAAEPVTCPTCADLARRTISAPFLADMNPHSRIAHQRNEKSAHEPQRVTRQNLDQHGAKRSPSHDHGHHHGHAHQQHHPTRPWMIGH